MCIPQYTNVINAVTPQLPYSSDLASRLFFVPEVEIHSERMQISDDKIEKIQYGT
jgi:hypothetical protein